MIYLCPSCGGDLYDRLVGDEYYLTCGDCSCTFHESELDIPERIIDEEES